MYTIRKAVLTDAEIISDIHMKTWKSTYTELLDEKDLTNMAIENSTIFWETVLKMPKKEHCTFVIENENENEMIGFISGGPERTKNFNFDSEIYTIYILDDYQKRGLGAKLLKVFAEEMKLLNYQSLLVWVLKQNPSSRFYERYQAKSVGEEVTTIGEGTYQETAYGWEDIDELLKIL